MFNRYRRNNYKIFVMFLIIVSFISIGYALIANVTLSLNGEAGANKLNDNFEVIFDKVEETKGSNDNITITTNKVDNTHYSFQVTNLEGYGDIATMRFSIVNNSGVSSAKFTISSTVNNTEYFDVDSIITDANENNVVTLKAGERAYLTVKVKVKKVSIDGAKSAQVNVKINALQTVD